MEEEKLNKKLKLNKIIIVVLLCVLLLALLIFLAKCFSAQNSQTNNDANMGMVASGDDYIFYYKYNSGLVKIKDKKEYQIANEQVYSLQYDNGYVYYTTPNSNGGIDIKKISQNGEKNQVLASVTSESTKMYLSNGYLYYTTSNPNTISKISVNGGDPVAILTRAIADFKVIDGTIYFTDDMEFLYSVDTNGENYKVILEEKLTRKFQIVDDNVYYYDSENKKLMSFNLEKKEKKEVSDKLNSDIFNVTSKGIYYLDSEKSKICFVDLKNKKSKELVDVSISNTKINIVGTSLYYLDKNSDGSYISKRVQVNGKTMDQIKY